MREDTPTVYLLAGPAGPGKIAYVRSLTDHAVVRLTAVDDVMSDELAAELITHVEAGRNVLVEYGSPDPAERDRCKALAESHGAQWLLVNFTLDHDHLAPRLA